MLNLSNKYFQVLLDVVLAGRSYVDTGARCRHSSHVPTQSMLPVQTNNYCLDRSSQIAPSRYSSLTCAWRVRQPHQHASSSNDTLTRRVARQRRRLDPRWNVSGWLAEFYRATPTVIWLFCVIGQLRRPSTSKVVGLQIQAGGKGSQEANDPVK